MLHTVFQMKVPSSQSIWTLVNRQKIFKRMSLSFEVQIWIHTAMLITSLSSGFVMKRTLLLMCGTLATQVKEIHSVTSKS